MSSDDHGSVGGRERGRARYVDALRGVAILLVVLGHWLITALVREDDGAIAAPELLATVPWTQWLTLGFQIMPVFFLAGGYAAAGSWERLGGGVSPGAAAGWVRGRAVRLLLPTAAYCALALGGLAVAAGAGVDPGLLGMVGWALAMQFWFLPVYLLISALTPWLYAAYRRWGLGSVVALGAAAVVVDVVCLRFTEAGWAQRVGALNYVLVWAVAYQLGFAWWDGRLARRRVLWTMAGGGALGYAALVAFGPFPVSLILVSGEDVSNTNPPSVAMLAWTVAQCGLCLLAAPYGERLLRRAWLWRMVGPLGRVSMTLYLWHMVPVLVAAAAFYLTDLAPEPVVGSAEWWTWRPVWLAVLAVLLLGLLALLRPLERVLARVGGWARPRTDLRVPWVAVAGLACAVFALARWAVEGLAGGGELSGVVVAVFAGGVLAVLLPLQGEAVERAVETEVSG